MPRRFDLASVMVVTAAYAVLFAGMRLLMFPVEAFLTVAGFLTAVGIAQAMLFGGAKPREASSLAGVAFWVAWLPIAFFWEGVRGWFCFGMTMVVFGTMVGHFGGVLVAGVFLVAHYLRRLLVRMRRTPSVDTSVSPWDDQPPEESPERDR